VGIPRNRIIPFNNVANNLQFSVGRSGPAYKDILRININRPPIFTAIHRRNNPVYREEFIKSLKDLQILAHALERSDVVVYGGGSIETDLSYELSEWAKGVKEIESVVTRTFAEAFLEIARLLAANAGFPPLKVLSEIKANRKKEGYPWRGVGVREGVIDVGSRCTSLVSVFEMEEIIESTFQIAELALTLF
jgi:chaperonin GroEL (HSP60 family)